MAKCFPVASGVLVLDKPARVNSYDVVREVKRELGRVKIGYLGTLDPLATGVLPILLGEGTKLAQFLERGDKVYEAIVCLGVTTDTQDEDGQTVRKEDLDRYDLSPARIREVAQRFRGRVLQVPPMYSALKHKGKRLYSFARSGEEVQRRPREVEVYDIRIMDVDPPYVRFHVECSKGTYIRTLAHDFGEVLGCGAHLAQLRRTQSGPFTVKEAFSLEDVKNCVKDGRLGEHIVSLTQALSFLSALEVDENLALRISQGQTVGIPMCFFGSIQDGERVRIMLSSRQRLVAVGKVTQVENGYMVTPVRVFHDGVVGREFSSANEKPVSPGRSGRRIYGSGR